MIETDRLILRKPSAHDWPQFRAFSLSERSRFVRVPDIDEGIAWRTFAMEFGHWDIHGYGMFMVTLKGDDTAIGMIGPWNPVDWPDTEIGWVMFSHEGQGYAAEAATAARLHAYDILGWTRIVSYVAPENTRSQALAERLGCVVDPDAAQPKPNAPPCLVYLHPSREEL